MSESEKAAKIYRPAPRTRIYAVGDLHGYPDALDGILAEIDRDIAAATAAHNIVVFLGDYIDRGPGSRAVVDRLLGLKEAYPKRQHIFLKGNHENGLLCFLADPHGARQDWLHWGGVETLASYGVVPDRKTPLERQAETLAQKLDAALPLGHRDFYHHLALHFVSGDYLFVHAGVRPGIALDLQTHRDLIMIRQGFLDYKGRHPWRVVHGHTSVEVPTVEPCRINIDTGLYYTGLLTCAVIENETLRFLESRVSVPKRRSA